jgi:ssRNA-specific RNase YbeY (16S rRNA maturation enzyme)
LKRLNLTSWKPKRGFWVCINEALKGLDTRGITLIFVDLEYIKRVKREIFGVEEGADVLTFVYDKVREVLVCPEFLKFDEVEVARRIIHGVLHALGYDHKVESKAGKMEEMENFVMEIFKRCYNTRYGKV